MFPAYAGMDRASGEAIAKESPNRVPRLRGDGPDVLARPVEADSWVVFPAYAGMDRELEKLGA